MTCSGLDRVQYPFGRQHSLAMAIAVTGGLLMSMLLSLIVIPVIFTHVDDLNEPETADTEAHSSNDHTTITFKPEPSKGGQGQRWLLWRALRQRRWAALQWQEGRNPIRAIPADLSDNLFGRVPLPGTRPRDVFPPQAASAACASCRR
ncbi:hypothetical protein CO665_01930 [Rhizobium anhuiense]|nr:hypothetical protein CO665_01930 [Rhizobium anhuiense]PDS59842.1 hypothetical protein CO663_07760 [Rhizobium anhuiense]